MVNKPDIQAKSVEVGDTTLQSRELKIGDVILRPQEVKAGDNALDSEGLKLGDTTLRSGELKMAADKRLTTDGLDIGFLKFRANFISFDKDDKEGSAIYLEQKHIALMWEKEGEADRYICLWHNDEMKLGKQKKAGNDRLGATTAWEYFWTSKDLEQRVQALESQPRADGLPSGSIIMWSGDIDEIPTGWVLCDGTTGTPDLRDRFIVGAGGNYDLAEKGGYSGVTLSLNQMPKHNHNDGDFSRLLKYDEKFTIKPLGPVKESEATPTDDFSPTGDFEPNLRYSGRLQDAGGNAAHENRPPYYALYFIMKL